MNRAMFVYILCLMSAVAMGQSIHRIDSLRRQLPRTTGEKQFDVLSDIAWEYRFINQDSTISYATRAYALGKKIGLRKKLAKPLNFIGVGHEYKNQSIEAYDAYKQALALATEQRDNTEIAYANNNAGRLFFNQGNTNRSLEHYLTALGIFQRNKDSTGIAYVYLNLAQLYQYQRDFAKAEDYFKKVYDIRLMLGGVPNMSALLQLGMFYREFGVLDKSNACFAKADSLCLVRRDNVSRAGVSILLAENRLQEGKLSEGEQLARQGLAYAQQHRLTRELANGNLVMGRILFELNQLDKARLFFEKVATTPSPVPEIRQKLDAFYYLGRIFNRAGQRQEALITQNQYLVLKDSMIAQDLARQIERLKFQFQLELEQERKENELLKTLESKNNTIIRKQQTLNVVYGGALIIIIIIALVLFRNFRLKQRHSAEIEKINLNLENIVNERTKTIKEQNRVLTDFAYFNAHQIRGPLARILGLISVLDLEYSKDAFGPYMHMLQQAGTDLDTAIRQISRKLDNTP